MRPDGSAYRTYPDVFVYPHFIAPDRGSVTLEVDGPPVLIIEVLSESTYEADVDLVRGKGYSYARAGVPEYMALDHTGPRVAVDRKSTRLNSSHSQISYAVFCLKKKNQTLDLRC